MSPEIARRVVSLFQRSGASDEHGEDLTQQETRLLGLLARGATYQAAGREMHVSVNTVRRSPPCSRAASSWSMPPGVGLETFVSFVS